MRENKGREVGLLRKNTGEGDVRKAKEKKKEKLGKVRENNVKRSEERESRASESK